MPNRSAAGRRLELLQGTLDLIILQTLQSGPQHGYGISRAIAKGSGELFHVDTGSLYPALHRLERRELVRSQWGTSENKQRAKYYRLTAAGRRQLLKERSRWDSFVRAMSGLLQPSESQGTA